MAESCSVGSWKAQHSWFLLFYPETNSPCFSFALTFTVHTRFSLSLSLSLLIHIFLSYVLFTSWTKQSSSFSQLIINPSHFCSALSYHQLFLHFFHLVCVCARACFHFNPFNNNSNIKKLVEKSVCSFYVKKRKKDNPSILTWLVWMNSLRTVHILLIFSSATIVDTRRCIFAIISI